jgi:glycosyltransferase domain-containing protein
MKKSENKITVDVVLFPPDEIMEKAIEVNQALIKTFDDKIVLNKQNCLPHISLAMGCIKKEDIPEIDTVLKDIADTFSPPTLTISDIRAETIPTGEKVSGFEMEKTKDIQLLHETVMNKLLQYFTYDVSLDTIYALPDQQVEVVTTYWIKNYQKESSFEKFSPHITIGIGEVEGETCGMNFPMKFNAPKLALGHLGNYCTCREILLLHDLKLNDDANYGCTIIIPTYNRPRYLKRVLSYYNGYAGNYNIIVADSSSDENKRINEKSISSFSSITVSHIKKYPPDFDPTYKIIDALKHVNTEYCAICADDDFVTPNGINQSVDFLEKNPDFTVAHGRYITFYLKPDRKGKLQFRYNPRYVHESISFPDAKSRLFFHLSNVQISPFYAVHRTDFLKMIYKEALEFSDADQFRELLLSMLALIYGKMKCLDVFYAARESIPDSAGNINKNLKDFVKDGTYGKKYAKFRECLAMHLSKKSQLDAEESKRVIDNAMSVHMRKIYPYKNILKSKMSNMSNALDYLRLPDWMNDEIRMLYRQLFVPKQMRMQDFMSSLGRPSSKYYDDFNTIRHYVLHHWKR